jgi:hypothetical protein
LFVNLSAKQKFDPPHIHYAGATTVHPWVENNSIATGVKVRDIGATLQFPVGDTGTSWLLSTALCDGLIREEQTIEWCSRQA